MKSQQLNALTLEGVKTDYLEYSLKKYIYDKQIGGKQLEEPVIPESVKKFMEKYL